HHEGQRTGSAAQHCLQVSDTADLLAVNPQNLLAAAQPCSCGSRVGLHTGDEYAWPVLRDGNTCACRALGWRWRCLGNHARSSHTRVHFDLPLLTITNDVERGAGACVHQCELGVQLRHGAYGSTIDANDNVTDLHSGSCGRSIVLD